MCTLPTGAPPLGPAVAVKLIFPIAGPTGADPRAVLAVTPAAALAGDTAAWQHPATTKTTTSHARDGVPSVSRWMIASMDPSVVRRASADQQFEPTAALRVSDRG